MVSISRSIALELLDRVFADDAYANILLPQLLRDRRVDSRDAALAQEIAYGAIRYKGTLDAIISLAANRKISDFDPSVLRVIELGSYQLLHTRVATHAAINETVDQAKNILNGRAAGLVNAALRRVSERSWTEWLKQLVSNENSEIVNLSVEYSHPDWIVTSLKLALRADGREEQLEALLAADNEPARINLVALPGLASREETDMLEPHPSSPIGFYSPSGSPNDVAGVRHGEIRVQDAGSQLVAMVLAKSKPILGNETWLDLCAGPGGKASVLVALANQVGAVVVCNEPANHRAELVRKALEHSNLRAQIRSEDGRHINGQFDRILVDAPCTGLGALRRRPEARWRKSQSDIPELTKLQGELVASAWKALKPGGILVYSTCSPHQSETTAVVERALREFGQSSTLLDANEILHDIQPKLELNRKRKTAQLWPHLHETDAMFIAVIAKSVS